MEDAVLAVQGQCTCRDVVGSVHFDDHIAVKVEVCQDGGRRKTLLEFLESRLLVRIPVDVLVLPGELRERSDSRGEAMCETSVKVGKT